MRSEVLENEAVFDFLKAQRYDVAIAEAWQMCPLGLFHALNIPTRLGSHAVPLSPQLTRILGIPSPTSFVPCKLRERAHSESVLSGTEVVINSHYLMQVQKEI
jgi:hypothetical protein